jgi:methyl-accepting chemotaxis protein
MSLVVRLRTAARRAMGTPDATDVATALGELWDAIESIRQSMERIERLAADNTEATSRRIDDTGGLLDDTRRQLDQLQGAVLEHAASLDRIAGQGLGQPST